MTCRHSTSHFVMAAGVPHSTRRLNCSTPSALCRDTAAMMGTVVAPWHAPAGRGASQGTTGAGAGPRGRRHGGPHPQGSAAGPARRPGASRCARPGPRSAPPQRRCAGRPAARSRPPPALPARPPAAASAAHAGAPTRQPAGPGRRLRRGARRCTSTPGRPSAGGRPPGRRRARPPPPGARDLARSCLRQAPGALPALRGPARRVRGPRAAPARAARPAPAARQRRGARRPAACGPAAGPGWSPASPATAAGCVTRQAASKREAAARSPGSARRTRLRPRQAPAISAASSTATSPPPTISTERAAASSACAARYSRRLPPALACVSCSHRVLVKMLSR